MFDVCVCFVLCKFISTDFVFMGTTHKKLKERFLMRRNRTKRANFRCNHLFQATYNRKQLNQLIFVHWVPGNWQKEKGMRLPS